jgi:hypothetical protein
MKLAGDQRKARWPNGSGSGHPGADALDPRDASSTDETPTQFLYGRIAIGQKPEGLLSQRRVFQSAATISLKRMRFIPKRASSLAKRFNNTLFAICFAEKHVVL